MFHIPFSQLLVTSVIAGVIGLGSFLVTPLLFTPIADMYLEPNSGTIVTGDTFKLSIMVSANEPVNVFKGELQFDPTILAISSIDYNTSIADLWAKLPWYSNGDGTLNFTGGSTRAGGFTGTGELITITFTSTAPGTAKLFMNEVRILRHDGLGTDADVVEPLDALFTINANDLSQKILVEKTATGPTVNVMSEAPKTDLNGDGIQTFIDISIFMTDFASQNMRADFNRDGFVNLTDLSILTNAS